MNCIWISSFLYANNLSFNRLGTGLDPFPNERFSFIYQGSYGLMWFATARGLLRYDGSAYRWYRHQPDDESSLPAGNVRVLFEDRAGNFWVGTNGGLAKLDRRYGSFKSVAMADHADVPLSANNIWCLFEDGTGTLWVGTATGLFSYENQRVAAFGNHHDLPEVGISAIGSDHRGQLWVGSEASGLFRFDTDQKRFIQISRLPAKKIRAIHRDREGHLWIGSLDEGAFMLDHDGAILRHFRTGQKRANTLASDAVTAIVSDQSGDLWLATLGGLHRYQPGLDQMSRIQHIPNRSDSLRANKIHHLFTGESGLLWLATAAAGIDLLNLNQTQIEHHRLEDNECWAIVKKDSGTVYLGTKHGVAILDGENQLTGWLLKDQIVRALYSPSPDLLYVGTDQGLFSINPTTADSPAKQLISDYRVWSILGDHSGQLWLATGQGLLGYHPDQNQMATFAVKPNDSSALSHKVITSLALDSPLYLWIGTFGGGLNRLNLASRQIDQYQKNSKSSPGLRANDVVALHTDPKGRLWIATLSGGLHLWQPSTQDFSSIRLSSPRYDQTPVAITSDSSGYLWLSTGAGLLRFHPETASFIRFRPNDGIQVGSALTGAIYYHKASGELLVGGIEGLARWYPQNLTIPKPAPILFTSFKVGQREIRHLLFANEAIHLSRHDKSFAIGFAMLDYLSLGEQAFAYLRQDVDDDWVTSENHGLVNYTNQSGLGGRYRVAVKASGGNGLWNQAHFTTQVQPPLWLTWLPLVLVATIGSLFGLMYAFISWREKKKRRILEIKARHAEQSQALAEDRAQIAEKQRALARRERQFQEEHATILQDYLERRATEIANDLHDGPLGALSGLGFSLNTLCESMNESEISLELRRMSNARLPNICHQLRHLCGDLLSPNFNDGLQTELDTYVQAMEKLNPNLVIERVFQTPFPSLCQDQMAMIFRISRILLKNIEKHACATKARICLQTQGQMLSLRVQDNGCGLKVPKDWDSFKQQKHYGLYMAHYFTHAMGGQFSAESEQGKGSVFSMITPIQDPN